MFINICRRKYVLPSENQMYIQRKNDETNERKLFVLDLRRIFQIPE